jgi:pilus assembly protein CpaE
MQTNSRTSGNIGVLPVCLDADSLSRLRDVALRMTGVALVGEFTEYFAAEKEAPRRLEPFLHRVCLVDFERNEEQAKRTAERLQEAMGGDGWVFALSSNADPQAIIAAMRSGCTEYLIKPLTLDKLGDALSRVVEKRRVHHSARSGKLITVVGAKGGSGVTTLALHLAIDLASRKKASTLLIDQHPSLGDVSLYCGLKRNQYSFYDLVNNTDRLDTDLVKGFVSAHASGLDVLDSPENLGTVNHAPPEYIDQTMDFLKDLYAWTVVDCPPGLTDETIATVRHSDYFMLVFTAEMPAVRNALRYLEHLQRLEFPQDRVRLVLNRHAKRGLISDEQIERALRKRISVRIPNDYAQVSKAINAGAPVLPSTRSEFSNAISAWADTITVTPGAEVRTGKGILGVLGF